ncbi:MAG TPA: HAD family phosphatase [Geobacteraceae bacterium]
MLQAVIFDFDGVIVDTEPLHYRAFQEILEPLGLGYSWEAYVDSYMGYDDREAFVEAFRAAGRSLDGTLLGEFIARKAAAFQTVIASGVYPYPGVVELIREISGKLPLAVCSGALPSDIDPILAQLGITDCFDVIVTAVDVAASKPDPASYTLAAAKLADKHREKNLTASSCLAIEDTPAGIASATGAGITVLAVTNSYPASMLSHAVRIVDSLNDVSLDDLRRLVP